MVMMSLELHDKLPFREVYLHAMVRDSKGEKMSKSKGNVVDPLDCIDGASLQKLAEGLRNTNLSEQEIQQAIKLQKAEFPAGIPQCGTDAMRLALCIYSAQPRSINLDLNKIVAQRNFCNKIYNTVRFAVQRCGLSQEFVDGCGFACADDALSHLCAEAEHLTLPNGFILSRLASLVHEYNRGMRTYAVAAAAEGCVNFWWDCLCDVFVELAKPAVLERHGGEAVARQTLLVLFVCVDQCLRMVAPFMPFLCEEMFQRLPRWPAERGLETVMYAPMPADCRRAAFGDGGVYSAYEQFVDADAPYARLRRSAALARCDGAYEAVRPLIGAARSLRAQYRLNGRRLRYLVQCDGGLSEQQLDAFRALADAESVALTPRGARHPTCGCVVVDARFSVLADLQGLVDAAAELQRLAREEEQVAEQRRRLEAQMASENYARLPQQLRDQNAAKLEGLAQRTKVIAELREQFEAMK